MESICPDQTTVHGCIEYYRNREPGAQCCSLRVQGKWLDYSRDQFWDLVCQYANVFAHVLSQPKLIIFSKKLDIHLLAAYIGAMKAGHLPAQISSPSVKVSQDEYNRKINHIHQITRFGAIFTDVAELDHYAAFPDIPLFSPDSLNRAMPPAQTFVSDEALVQFSSGSTGLQKGVVLTHHAIIEQITSYAAILRLNHEDKIATWLPLYHDMGLIAAYLMPLMCGVPVYQMDPFDWIMQPDLLLQLIEEKRATITHLPNFAFHVLVNKGKVRDLSSVRLWVNCSEPVQVVTHREFCAKFPSVAPESLTVCYALAENTFAVSQTLPWQLNSTKVHPVRKAISCGKPIHGVEVKIFDASYDGDGEIGIRSPSLFKHFIDGSQPLQEGFYLTGDLGFVDGGEVFVTGRKKDIIIVQGKNIFPQDVEFAASQTDGVYPGRVAAFGLWNEELGSEELIVLVERKQGQMTVPLKIAVQKLIQEEIGIVPKRVEVLEHMSLIKTSSGKISRTRTKEIYLAKGFELL